MLALSLGASIIAAAPCARETTSLETSWGTGASPVWKRGGVLRRLFLEWLEKLGLPQTPFPHARFGVLLDNKAR